ncbi:MAG: galactose mutarotase [Verrucomicrobia bacterium]|nr:galactose mutarotase [Verrucomicrobiota bacterium]
MSLAHEEGKNGAIARISKHPFGVLPDGRPVDLYKLTNSTGMEVSVLTFGGILQSIKVPDKNGKLEDVTLGFDNLEDYIKKSPYFGAIIGRFANRIANGRYTLSGISYQIPINDGPNALHGGLEGFDKRLWAAAALVDADWVGIELVYISPHEEMGFPGNLSVTVRYTLSNHTELRVDYSAATDRTTIINLTNHAYFNLAGAGNGQILDHLAMINADRFTPINQSLIPTGEIASVEGTHFDFRRPTPIGSRIHLEDQQLRFAEQNHGGYDFNWVLNCPGDLKALAARVVDPISGREITVYTDQPGLQFYSGNFLDGSLTSKDGKTFEHWGAFALETQNFPDAPNHSNFPNCVLKPGEKYSSTTIFRF